jgi:hypothetical protein
MKTDLVSIAKYTNSLTQQDKLETTKDIKLQYDVINEILNKKFLNLFDSNYIYQVITRNKSAIIATPKRFHVINNINISNIDKQIKSYKQYKNDVLSYINENQYKYLELSSKILRNKKLLNQSKLKNKKNIFIVAFYLPKLRGRVDTYKKVDSNNNPTYSVETDLKIQIKSIIFKYQRDSDIFIIHKEISTPFQDVIKPEDNNDFKTYSPLSSSNIKRAISVNLYKSIDESIDFLKMNFSNLEDLSIKVDHIESNKNNNDINKQQYPSLKLKKEQQANYLQKDENEKNNNNTNRISIYSGIKNIPIEYNIGPITYKTLLNSYPINLSYEKDFSFFYIQPSYTYNIASLQGEKIQINGLNIPVNNNGFVSSKVFMQELSILLGKKIYLDNIYLSLNTKLSVEYINMGFLDENKNNINSIFSNVLLSPGISIGYDTNSFNISIGSSYNIPIYKIQSNALFTSISDDFKRKQSMEFYFKISLKY